MKFIIDAQLPLSLNEIFTGHDLVHTKDLPFGNKTKDKDINELSIKENRVLITKDTDFYYSYLASKKPYKLVLVKIGNARIHELREYFSTNRQRILDLLEVNSFLILEKDQIRILD